MSIHKLTAGDGYSYLTRQVAALDATERGHTGLADYYSQRGESPGRWLGSALGDVDLQDGQEVTAAQMAALFGEGKHPNADAITEQVMDKRAGGSGRLQDVQDAIRLGAPFAVIDSAPAFRVAVAKACAQVNAGLGMPHDRPLPAAERARVRTDVDAVLTAVAATGCSSWTPPGSSRPRSSTAILGPVTPTCTPTSRSPPKSESAPPTEPPAGG